MIDRIDNTAKPSWASVRGIAIAAQAAAVAFGFVMAAAPAVAQSGGLQRAEVVEQLHARYAETQRAIGVTDTGKLIEVFTTGDGSTWTLVLTEADGTSRVIAAGATWIKR